MDSKNPRDVVSRQRKPQEDSRKVRDAEFINKVRTVIDRSPTRSFRSIAAELNVSDTTIKEDLSPKKLTKVTKKRVVKADKPKA